MCGSECELLSKQTDQSNISINYPRVLPHKFDYPHSACLHLYVKIRSLFPLRDFESKNLLVYVFSLFKSLVYSGGTVARAKKRLKGNFPLDIDWNHWCMCQVLNM